MHEGVPFPFPFPAPPPPPLESSHSKKLRKKRDGHESDGYVSDGPRRGKTKIRIKEDEGRVREKGKEKDEDGVPERTRKKSVLAAAAQSARRAVAGSGGGYDTDGEARTRKKSAKKDAKLEKEAAKAAKKVLKDQEKDRHRSPHEDDPGYATDGASSRKPRRFFGALGGGKSSKPDLKAEARSVPPMPLNLGLDLNLDGGGGSMSASGSGGPAMPLPIAERFATTLSTGGSTAPSRAPSPMLPRAHSPPRKRMRDDGGLWQPGGREMEREVPHRAVREEEDRVSVMDSWPTPGRVQQLQHPPQERRMQQGTSFDGETASRASTPTSSAAHAPMSTATHAETENTMISNWHMQAQQSVSSVATGASSTLSLASEVSNMTTTTTGTANSMSTGMSTGAFYGASTVSLQTISTSSTGSPSRSSAGIGASESAPLRAPAVIFTRATSPAPLVAVLPSPMATPPVSATWPSPPSGVLPTSPIAISPINVTPSTPVARSPTKPRSGSTPKHPPVAPLSIMRALRMKASLDNILPGRGRDGGRDAKESREGRDGGNTSPASSTGMTQTLIAPALSQGGLSPALSSPGTPGTPFVIVPSAPGSPASSNGFAAPQAFAAAAAAAGAPVLPPLGSRARSRSPSRARSPFPRSPVSPVNIPAFPTSPIPPGPMVRAPVPTRAISVPNTAAQPTPARLVIPGSVGNSNTYTGLRSPSPLLFPGGRASLAQGPGLPRSPSPHHNHTQQGMVSPNVLAYYELPPPGPAPRGPLPPPPGAPGGAAGPQSPTGDAPRSPYALSYIDGPAPGALRQRVVDRTPRTLPPELSAMRAGGGAQIQRGKESPFPVRPLLPPPAGVPPVPAGMVSLPAGSAAGRRLAPSPQPGQAPRDMQQGGVGADRYEQAKRRAAEMHAARAHAQSWVNDEGWDDDDDDEDVYADLDGDEDGSAEAGVDLAYALGGRKQPPRRPVPAPPQAYAEYLDIEDGDGDASRGSLEHSDESHYPPSADGHAPVHAYAGPGGAQPYGFMTADPYAAPAARPRPRKPQVHFSDDGHGDNGNNHPHDGQRATQYSTYTLATEGGERLSRWSGSVYSRASILDEDASGATRDRLVRRVEAMLAKEGKGAGADAPQGGRTWGRF